MIKKLLGFLFFVSVSSLIYCNEMIRPLELYIIDADTEKPIEGIIVYYQLEKGRSPFGVEWSFHNISLKKAVSDKNGKVYFPQQKISLWFFERIRGETVFVNLFPSDIEQNSEIKEIIKIFDSLFIHSDDAKIKLINSLYKGMIISTLNYTSKTQNMYQYNKWDYFIINNSFIKEIETVVIKLSRPTNE